MEVVRNSLPYNPVLCRTIPIHAFTHYIFKTRFNIITSSIPEAGIVYSM
jgi:hypothetical protein